MDCVVEGWLGGWARAGEEEGDVGGRGWRVVGYRRYLERQPCPCICFFSGYILTRSVQVAEAEQVQLLMQLCDASTDEQVKVRCIGTLECLAQHPQSIDANQVRSHARTYICMC